MSGIGDDSGGRHLRQADGRRTRRARRSEDEQSSEFSLPVAPDLDEDDPKTLAEDAQWAAKLRPGRAPSGSATPAPDEDGPQPATSADDLPVPAPPPESPWDSYPTDGSGEFWRSSVGGSAGDHTGGPWEATPAGDDSWAASPAGDPAGDWTAPGGAFEPAPPPADWSLGGQPAAGGDPGTGSWGGAGASAGWDPDEDPWSPGPSSRPPWEPDPFGAPPAPQPYQAGPPSARPWEAPLAGEAPLTAGPPSFPATEPPASGSDVGALFGEPARDHQAGAQPAGDPASQDDDPAVQAAHAEARRLIEEATGRWLWDDEKPSRSGEIAASGGWNDAPPPPVPHGPAPFGPASSFAAPTAGGPSATPPPPSRELSHTRGPGRHEQPDEPGSRLWAPDRRADEQDAGGGVGWLWSVEEYGASPPVPGSWLREPPGQQAHEVDGLARPIEGRRLRQLESRSHGRRVRPARRWPVRVAVAAWIVLFAVVCWLYLFPWLEGVLPENF